MKKQHKTARTGWMGYAKGWRPAILIMVGLGVWSGCAETDETTAPEAGERSSGATGPAGYLQTTVAQRGRAEEVAGLRSVQQAVETFAIEEERLPRELGELISRGYLDRLPNLPRGREFVLNTTTGQVSVEDQEN